MTNNKDKINKMKSGREQYYKETSGVVLRLVAGVEVWVDKYQYILKINGYAEGYYDSLDSVLDGFLNLESKKYLVARKRKEVEDLIVSLKGFRADTEKLLKPFDTSSLISNIITNHKRDSIEK